MTIKFRDQLIGAWELESRLSSFAREGDDHAPSL
jgi:hypothetical protein